MSETCYYTQITQYESQQSTHGQAIKIMFIIFYFYNLHLE